MPSFGPRSRAFPLRGRDIAGLGISRSQAWGLGVEHSALSLADCIQELSHRTAEAGSQPAWTRACCGIESNFVLLREVYDEGGCAGRGKDRDPGPFDEEPGMFVVC